MRTTAKVTAAALIGGTVLLGGNAAMAAGPPSADEAAAAKVASSATVKQRLGTFFVHLDQHQKGQTTNQAVTQAAAAAKAPKVEGDVQRVYSLSPAFVKGTPNAAVADFVYLAVGAKSASGQQATMWLTKSGKSWNVMNIISGNDESAYPAMADGGLVFTEPQIRAWYRVKDGRVTGLNDAAKTSVGKGMTVGSYQKLVQTRYADKLPGSAYQRSGQLGGYSPTTGVGDRAPDRGAAPVLLALGAGGALTAAAGVAVARRRRLGSY
ncbi:hypothetical protein BZB76_4554 [Actinomadura pelletieri DSM 43383]|uniref:LPXTG-motif cell wall-anchored protein n=1 Tax=Actinomadura pelletieri DSM 43383 TaxID=1120940 RepID=A0A495QHY3_9ACTN|nr:hypothetical protein [Actinomadura pelletieri]RKS71747.1 hypothetical protein BZB76_4554 [Actinomadura pelletieri DSM 43383]